MFFLLRVAFWLGLVFVLLPSGKPGDGDKAGHVDAMQAASAAASVMSDMSQFCTRQPSACDIGGKAAVAVGERAQNGARKVYQFITDKTEKAEKKREDKKPDDKKQPDHTGSIADIATASQNTLSDDDLALEWQSPVVAAPSPRD